MGGMQWGSAADSSRIYVSNNNFNNVVIDLAAMRAVPNTAGATAAPKSTQGGIAAAVDAWSGKLLWTFANPTMHCECVACKLYRLWTACSAVIHASFQRPG